MWYDDIYNNIHKIYTMEYYSAMARIVEMLNSKVKVQRNSKVLKTQVKKELQSYWRHMSNLHLDSKMNCVSIY